MLGRNISFPSLCLNGFIPYKNNITVTRFVFKLKAKSKEKGEQAGRGGPSWPRPHSAKSASTTCSSHHLSITGWLSSIYVSLCSFISSSELGASSFPCIPGAHGSGWYSWMCVLLRDALCMCWYCIGKTGLLIRNSFSKSWWYSSFKISFTEKGVVLVELGCIPK